MKKYYVEVRTIKYNDIEIPTVVIVNKKTYMIQEIISEEFNAVFNGGGVGTKYTVSINKMEKLIYQDKHSLKWHVYSENTIETKIEKEDQADMSIKDFDYLI